jgi:hypothetical protein
MIWFLLVGYVIPVLVNLSFVFWRFNTYNRKFALQFNKEDSKEIFANFLLCFLPIINMTLALTSIVIYIDYRRMVKAKSV